MRGEKREMLSSSGQASDHLRVVAHCRDAELCLSRRDSIGGFRVGAYKYL